MERQEAQGNRYLNDGRSSSDGVVGDRLVAASKDDVSLACKAAWYDHSKATIDRHGFNKRRSGDGNEGSINLAAIGSLDNIVLHTALASVKPVQDRVRYNSATYGSQKSDGVTGRDGHHGRGSQGELGEGLDRQRRVARRAGHDELRSQRVDLIQTKRSVKGLRKWGLVQIGAKIRRMT